MIWNKNKKQTKVDEDWEITTEIYIIIAKKYKLWSCWYWWWYASEQKKRMISKWPEWQQEIWECQTNTKEFEWCWWWRWFCKISARFNNNYNTHSKSDNDDRDEENIGIGKKTQWVQITIYIVMMIETTTGNMNKNCKQIQKNFNMCVDDDDVIKHNLSSIQKDTKTDKYKELKSWWCWCNGNDKQMLRILIKMLMVQWTG